MTMPLESYRTLFPVTKTLSYLNHAATGPYSSLTRQAMESYLHDTEMNGGIHYEKWNKIKEELRSMAGQLLNCGSGEIAFVSNTSEGANIVAQGLNISAGDNVVILEKEFPANVYPWLNLKKKGVQVKVAPTKNGRVSVDDIISLVDSNTKVVAASSVAYYNGFSLDLEELGSRLYEKNTPLYVDAIQSLGVIPMDVKKYRITFLAADGHKWLLSPEGAALFFCSREGLSLLDQAYMSWFSVAEPFDFDNTSQCLADGARRFECGVPNILGLVGLHQTMSILQEAGIGRIMNRVQDLTSYAEEGLKRIGCKILSPRKEGEKSGILSFSHPRYAPDKLAKLLSDAKVITTARGKGVRISPHFYNNEEDLDRLLSAIPN